MPSDRGVIYDVNYHSIGFGVTITGPRVVGRMTSSIDVKMGEKVLEIGTGSGYQSAYLSNLTDKVWTIEIIKPLAERTRAIHDALIARGYTEFKSINTKQADGYYGWEENAPFDKIIVTCGIDHIPPPLLQQLKTGGIMVIPVGPPGAQHILKVNKDESGGQIAVKRSDIYWRQAGALRALHQAAGRRRQGDAQPALRRGVGGQTPCLQVASMTRRSCKGSDPFLW